MYNYANVLYRGKGDMIKAEELARRALRIRISLLGTDHHSVGTSSHLLARILIVQKMEGNEEKTVGNETAYLLERSLAISLKNEGPDAMNTATGYMSLGTFYYKNPSFASMKQKRGEEYCEIGLEILTRVYGHDHPYRVKARNRLRALTIHLL